MNEAPKKGQGKALENFFVNLGKVGLLIMQVSWHGLSRAILTNGDRLFALAAFYSLVFFLVYWNWKHLVILHWILPGVFSDAVLKFFVLHVSQFVQFLLFAGIPTVALGVLLGAVHFIRMLKYQNDLKHIGLKSATGLEPKVLDVEELEPFKRKITLASLGVGLEHYKTKKSDLEAAFGAIVEDICISPKSRKLVEIYLAEKELRSMVSYLECAPALQLPYSFVIGESLGGVLTQSIRSLPHLLIAGTSGNGKSVFFNQTLVSLLRTSPHIQMCLLDLKLGVEVKAYSDLPNVRIAKDASEAVQLLQAVVSEMKERFKLLEKGNLKRIDPEAHGKDLILIGVDEASVLYGKKRGDKSGNELIALARDLTDEIAKLGRAACIHLIVATQKVTNESIDTKIQENVGGRVCFRVNTLQGSNTVLGNKKAFELPEVKGRAIWACGNDFTEVQTAFVSESVIAEEIKAIKADFESGKRKCLQDIISSKHTTKTVEAEQDAVIDKVA